MAEVRGVIFDLDGVLVDTAVHHFGAWKAIADQLGFSFTEAHNERLKGVSRMDSLNILLEIGGVTLAEEEKQKLAAQKNEQYVSKISTMDAGELLPGASNLLTELQSENIPAALGSASRNAPLILKNTGITPYFEAVVDGNDVEKAKPDPQVFLLGAERMRVPPEDCVVFEDAQAGVDAGRKAGMTVIGVGSPSDLQGAHAYISSLAETNAAHIRKVHEGRQTGSV
ncbi:beta-phosphoglucomutase [Alkalicoccus urumqiensis]|uniref:beta-phosphoglucomutase n=1 Tax=Alkalicoccus urumqiensis TaxID=1548213 RepID=UPI001FE10FF3|nr:beta-phosphoglucomutase [Alkalicoccus urumqiensis]